MDLPAPPDPLPRPVVDTHCHLDATQELSGLEPADALARAAAVGVPRVVQVGCDRSEADDLVRRLGPVLLPGPSAQLALTPRPVVRLAGRGALADEVGRLLESCGLGVLLEDGESAASAASTPGRVDGARQQVGVVVGGASFVMGFAMVWWIWWLAALALVVGLAAFLTRMFGEEKLRRFSADEIAAIEGAHGPRAFPA